MSNKPCVVRLKKGGTSVEILCKPGTVGKYRQEKLGFSDCVLSEDLLFSNAQKMTQAKDSDVKKVCGGLSGRLAVQYVLQEGEWSMSKAEMAEIVDARRREIVHYLVKYYYDASKKPPIPHSSVRVESALREMRYNVDHVRGVEDQIKEILKRLPEVLPVVPQNPPHLERESLAREQVKLERQEAGRNKESRDDKGRSRYGGKKGGSGRKGGRGN